MVRRLKKFTAVLIMVFVMVFAAALPVSAAVKAPSVSVSYTDKGASVDVTLTWDDFGNDTQYHVDWADKMISDSSGLNYTNIDTGIVSYAGKKSVTLQGLIKYKNYYVRVINQDETTQAVSHVRVYPVDTSGRTTSEYGHGNFKSNTAMCAYCHSNHASLKEQLINEATYYQLCKLCHGTASSQSKYDVMSGKVSVEGGTVNSLAGPFEDGVTSRHDANDSAPGWSPVSVPGSDSTKSLSLTCLSCHQGHAGNDDNYRLLRKTLFVDDAKTEGLKTVNIDFDAYAITSTNVSGESLYMVKGNTEFCSSCHLDYDDGNALEAGRDSRLTVNEEVYRHPTTVAGRVYSIYGANGLKNIGPSPWGPLPLQYNAVEAKPELQDKRTSVVCSTCHFAHGTTKQFNTENGTNKYILRLDNYGTCQSCHQK